MSCVNVSWAERMLDLLNAGNSVDVTCRGPKNPNWLISELSNRNIPFKVYNLGAGVRRVTTDTDTCPCCKKKLAERGDG